MSGPMRPDSLAAWDPPTWPSWLRCRRSFFQKLRLDLKPTIKIVPDALRKGAPQKHRNTETEIRSCRLEGENSGGALPERSPPPPTTSPSTPWWRGSSPPLDYGFVEVTYVSLLSWASLISTVWAAEHDYGHLCNTFVVDLYELIYVWDCNCFISVMKVDAYYVPRSYLVILIKHVYESVCGGTCALDGVTGGG